MLIGETAEVLQGSPLPLRLVVTIVPRAGERARLDAALSAVGARPLGGPARRPVDTAERWRVERSALELVLAPAPAGSRGYEDLRRDAAPVQLGDASATFVGLSVSVASLLDLVRLAEASTSSDDNARVPTLRRTLELTGRALGAASEPRP